MTNNAIKIIEFPVRQKNLHNSVFIFIDLQKEYQSLGRAYALEDVEDCLSNCQRILKKARQYGMTIAHFRTLMGGTFFNQSIDFSNWIEEFSPQPNEMVFDRQKPSVYSNEMFTSFIDMLDAPELIVMGLTGESGCLSTIVEGQHRNHKITYVSDASASHSIGQYSEKQSHEFLTNIMGMYSQIATTDEVMDMFTEKTELMWI